MTLEEYNSEIEVLKDNLIACKENLVIIEKEKDILNSGTVYKGCEDEFIKINEWVNFRYFKTEEMLSNLKCALRYIKDNKVKDHVYNSYIARYKHLVNSYVDKSSDVFYLSLADKYIGGVNSYIFEK